MLTSEQLTRVPKEYEDLAREAIAEVEDLFDKIPGGRTPGIGSTTNEGKVLSTREADPTGDGSLPTIRRVLLSEVSLEAGKSGSPIVTKYQVFIGSERPIVLSRTEGRTDRNPALLPIFESYPPVAGFIHLFAPLSERTDPIADFSRAAQEVRVGYGLPPTRRGRPRS